MKSKIEIAFGNLKEDFKDNYYLATIERTVENKNVECININNNYATFIDNVMGVDVFKYINLTYFKEWYVM